MFFFSNQEIPLPIRSKLHYIAVIAAVRLTGRTTGYLESLLQSRQGDDDVDEGHRLDGAQQTVDGDEIL